MVMKPNVASNDGSAGAADANSSSPVADSDNHPKKTGQEQTSFCVPRSYDEARDALRNVMETYMEVPLPVVKSTTTTSTTSSANLSNKTTSSSTSTTKWWECLFRYHVDFYAGAAVSLALLGISIASLGRRKDDETMPEEDAAATLNDATVAASASLTIYRAQVSASALLLAGSFFCIFLARRREYTFAHDSDVSKRKTISKFLSASHEYAAKADYSSSERMATQENEGGTATTNVDTEPQTTNNTTESTTQQQTVHHSGTSRTGIYPVYRRRCEEEQAFWYSIPTLLLVKGDFIALQVGDVAPARCNLTNPTSLSKRPIVIKGGERITLESFGDQWGRSPSLKFPPGKTTICADSSELLDLCNHMSVFVLDETPLESFLRLPNARQRLPQIHRQLRVIRQVMFLFAVVVFVVTFVIIFVRPGMTSSDLSLVIHTPFLAALASLPVVAPVCLFFLEVLGTARILVEVHPHVYASPQNAHEGQAWLFFRYLLATFSSRLYLQGLFRRFQTCANIVGTLRWSPTDGSNEEQKSQAAAASELICVPPASTFLLEKLGVATAFILIDDELACEPYSIPQQLLIPSNNGLKLLDLCPTYDTDSDDESIDDTVNTRKQRARSYGSSPDSDSDSDDEHRFNANATTSNAKRKRKKSGKRRRIRKVRDSLQDSEKGTQQATDDTEVQFEDPLWWHFLPSLKCIGLACSLVDDHENSGNCSPHHHELCGAQEISSSALQMAAHALVHYVCSERERVQLRSLARCIGFVTSRNSIGERGDISYFDEKLRINVVSTRLLDERLAMDAHALGLEESRSWGLLRSDSTSVIVQDKRSNAYQLLTVGDSRVITSLCHEAWQGENSTIFPLNAVDRATILETSRNWALSDLDVAAFAYSPVRSTLETRLSGTAAECDVCRTLYLVDNSSSATSRDRLTEDWALVNNQIFLGVLGSSVIPRKEIQKLLEVFDEAGVRFVYFSPRNMRRTKELAAQIGIDVAWNCAISLRDLDEGEEDPHRMLSAYADWSLNAKLPHGVENVRKHLENVDNVPLLVSLFTDATKESTMEMVKTFQEYNDTVLAMGLSHIRRNAPIFSTADISVGADVLAEELASMPSSANILLPHEVEFIASISSHSCVFNLRGATSSSLMPSFIERGRSVLEAASGSTLFLLYGSVSFSLYACFCMCSVSTAVTFVPTLGSVLFLQLVLPFVSLGLAMSDSDDECMYRVPPKNDQSLTFSRNEGRRLYTNTLLKALLPAVLTQVLYLIAFGELMIMFEPELLLEECAMSVDDLEQKRWTSVIRCAGLRDYSGVARTSSGALVLAELVLCVIVSSASFIHATHPIVTVPIWSRSRSWMFFSTVGIILVAVYLLVALEKGSFSALSWYYFVLAVIIPFLCLMGNELIKRSERKHIDRAAKLRRLQFETRLGMWSPK